MITPELDKITRNHFWFSLSSWGFFCLVLLLIVNFQEIEKKTFLFLLSVHNIFALNFSFSSQFSRFCGTISLSPLDFQDFVEQLISPLDTQDFVPCFLSWEKSHIWRTEVSSPHLRLAPVGKYIGCKVKSSSLEQWVWMVVWGLEPPKITLWASTWWLSSQARVTSAKFESLSSIKFPNALLMLSWKSFHWRLFKEEQTISLFSFYSRNKRKKFQYSPSLLEIVEM